MKAEQGCPFCDYDGPSEVLLEGTVLAGDGGNGLIAFPYFVIEPLHPVTPGHRLVIPRKHVADFREYPRLLGAMMQVAADIAGGEPPDVREGACNLIASAGAEATQTVGHVHVHIVPRREGDGLPLPWTLTVPDLTMDHEDAEVFRMLVEVTRDADTEFESSGGGTRHWLRECFLPTLREHGLAIVKLGQK